MCTFHGLKRVKESNYRFYIPWIELAIAMVGHYRENRITITFHTRSNQPKQFSTGPVANTIRCDICRYEPSRKAHGRIKDVTTNKLGTRFRRRRKYGKITLRMAIGTHHHVVGQVSAAGYLFGRALYCKLWSSVNFRQTQKYIADGYS